MRGSEHPEEEKQGKGSEVAYRLTRTRPRRPSIEEEEGRKAEEEERSRSELTALVTAGLWLPLIS